MITAILSILFLTLFVWVINKKLPIPVCSICAGVTLTWLWMLSGMWFGFLSVPRYELLAAILMGASIGGIVTEFKKILYSSLIVSGIMLLGLMPVEQAVFSAIEWGNMGVKMAEAGVIDTEK